MRYNIISKFNKQTNSGGFIMENMNDIVDMLVEDLDIPEDIPVTYEVSAIGFNKEDELTGAYMVLSTFTDPDQAVEYAKAFTLADVIKFIIKIKINE